MALERYKMNLDLKEQIGKHAANITEYHKHRETAVDTDLNCSLGKCYPVENAMVPVKLCTGICIPGGQRSRIEWCGKCDKIE